MSALWLVFAIILFVWPLTRGQGRSRFRRWEPDPRAEARDDEMARLKERFRAPGESITGEDRRLRRDVDGL